MEAEKNVTIKINDGTLDSKGIRVFKTCEEYAIYMKGNPDMYLDPKTNPVPDDAMSLFDLRKKSEAEILGIANHIGSLYNKSDIRSMFGAGYGFTWKELDTIAQFLGFIKTSGNARDVHYEMEGVKEIRPATKEYSDLSEEIYDAAMRKIPLKRTPIYMFPEDEDRFKSYVEEKSLYGTRKTAQAVVFHKMIDRILM